MAIIFMKHLKKEWPEKVSEVLLKHNLEELSKSGLSDKTILEARIYSASPDEARQHLNRKVSIGAGIVFPYLTQNGFSKHDINFKPDKPFINKKGKPQKYIRPTGIKSRLYITRSTWKIVDDPSVDIFITEGEKKALMATQEGFYTIAVSGAWNWKSNRQPLDDFKLIKLKGRTIYIAYDSDKFKNHNVQLAERHLAEFLIESGATVRIINLPLGGIKK